MSQFTMLNRIAAITVSAKQFHWNTRSRCFTWPNGYSKVSIKQIAFFATSFCVANETDISLVLVIQGANVSSDTDGKLHTQSNKSQVLYSSWHSTFTQLRNRNLSTSNSAQLRRVSCHSAACSIFSTLREGQRWSWVMRPLATSTVASDSSITRVLGAQKQWSMPLKIFFGGERGTRNPKVKNHATEQLMPKPDDNQN